MRLSAFSRAVDRPSVSMRDTIRVEGTPLCLCYHAPNMSAFAVFSLRCCTWCAYAWTTDDTGCRRNSTIRNGIELIYSQRPVVTIISAVMSKNECAKSHRARKPDRTRRVGELHGEFCHELSGRRPRRPSLKVCETSNVMGGGLVLRPHLRPRTVC